jgi:uncharacterized damage-inducible protein DinB
MTVAPERNEAAPYYFTYIDRVSTDDIVGFLQTQLSESMLFLEGISEEKSLYRYAPEKWSIRQVLNHVTDTERLFQFRALWFARGFEEALPSFEQEIAVAGAAADECAWRNHVEEFKAVRLASLAFFRNLPSVAWMRAGVASGKKSTVRAIGYIIAGHYLHHATILRERYLSGPK